MVSRAPSSSPPPENSDELDLAPDTPSRVAATGRLLWLQRACPSTTLDKDVLLCWRNSNEKCPLCQTVCFVSPGQDLKDPISFSRTLACSVRFSTTISNSAVRAALLSATWR